jgi:cell division protein FtsA
MNDLSNRPGNNPPPPRHVEMRARPTHTGSFGVLDIGSSKITCMIGRAESDGRLRALGFGWQKSYGIKSGGIVDLDEAEPAIRAAVGAAEDMADTRLKSVVVNLSCGQPASRLFNVQWPIDGRPVMEDDIRRVVREARARANAEGRCTIHVLPLGFATDETDGVADPRGLYCDTLTARLHVVDASRTAIKSVAACLARCELEIAAMVSAPFASGLATLVEDERTLGAIVIDMGGGTTTLAVFAEGQVLHTAQLPVGGQHVTNDVARLLSTHVADAERLKTLYGTCQPSPDDARELLSVPMVGEADHQIAKVPRSALVSVIRPRLEEIFELARDRIDTSGLGRAAGNRVVLTGGAAQLVGAREMAAEILKRQVRIGRPFGVIGLPDSATGPNFSTLTGLLAFATGDGQTLHDLDLSREPRRGPFGKIKAFLQERL